jgi:hypothetical protein
LFYFWLIFILEGVKVQVIRNKKELYKKEKLGSVLNFLIKSFGGKRLNRILIGGFTLLGGLLVSLTIILSGAIYATGITGWSGKSKLWFVIFGEKQYGDEVVQSLFLGFPFFVGVLLAAIGLIILGYEYYITFKK